MSNPGNVEIERKFLVHTARMTPDLLGSGDAITQGYLSQRPTVRVRVVEPTYGDPQGFITVKGPGSLVRAEFEYVVPATDAHVMLEFCATTLRKTRYSVSHGNHVWDVDCYHGHLHGLWTAEVELGTPDETFDVPEWVTEDVTEDPRYTNVALARDGVPRA